MQPLILVQYLSDTSFLSLRGAEIPCLRFGASSAIPLMSLRGAEGDEAISVEGYEIATPRQVGAPNDT
jgi:hypothetical protein